MKIEEWHVLKPIFSSSNKLHLVFKMTPPNRAISPGILENVLVIFIRKMEILEKPLKM